MSRHRFYRIDARESLHCQPDLPEGYAAMVWRPRRDGLPPADLPFKPFAFWWLLDRTQMFANGNAGVLMVLHEGRLAHRSLVTPRWFRFPSMAADDLQIGDVFTDPAHRGLGLARSAIALIHREWAGQFRRMWYLCAEDNEASIRVIETCGYRLQGLGERTRPFGLRAFGSYRMDKSIREDTGP